MAAVQKVLIHKSGALFYVKDVNADFHTQYGFVNKNDIKKNGLVKSNKDEKFFVLDAGFIDKFRKIKRGAQIITLKDAGCIIAETGINSQSRVLDAGGGSGALSSVLGNIAGTVFTYEIREDFCKIIQENISNFGFQNVSVHNKDVSKGISEKALDLVVFDLPEPSKAIKHAIKALKIGGFLVLYLPSMTQVISAIEKIRKEKKLIFLKAVENIQREWKVDDKICRPEFDMLGHTGFLIFTRKIN